MRGGWVRSVLGVGVAGLVACVVAAAPAGAGEAGGCTWTLTSLDADGTVIDTATGPGPGATKGDPLSIDQDGSISYEATTDAVIANGSWTLEASGGPPLSFSGDVKNDSGDTERSGTEDLDGRLSVKLGPFGQVAVFSGLLHVKFKATGANGATCTASGWFETSGGTLASLPFMFGSLFSLFGIGLLVTAWPVAPGGTATATGAASAAGAGGSPADGAGPRPGPIGGAT